MLDESRQFVFQLQATLDCLVVVEQAVGIVMSRSNVTEQEARRQLRIRSEYEDQELPVVAQQLIEATVRRARQQRRG